MIKPDEILREARDMVTVKRVFGEPYEKEGVTLIPAASIGGGAGAGSGSNREPEGRGEGGGGGFGVRARPSGAYVIRGGDVSWRPALDLNRIIAGGQMVAIVALLTLRTIVKSRARSRPFRVD